VLRADAGVVEAGGDAVRLLHLAVLILEEIGAGAVQHAGAAGGEGGGVAAGVDAVAGRFDADDADVGVVDERREEADRVAAAADAGDDR
jgi:hypothetical protein